MLYTSVQYTDLQFYIRINPPGNWTLLTHFYQLNLFNYAAGDKVKGIMYLSKQVVKCSDRNGVVRCQKYTLTGVRHFGMSYKMSKKKKEDLSLHDSVIIH
jgi:hypothetical protein